MVKSTSFEVFLTHVVTAYLLLRLICALDESNSGFKLMGHVPDEFFLGEEAIATDNKGQPIETS